MSRLLNIGVRVTSPFIAARVTSPFYDGIASSSLLRSALMGLPEFPKWRLLVHLV